MSAQHRRRTFAYIFFVPGFAFAAAAACEFLYGGYPFRPYHSAHAFYAIYGMLAAQVLIAWHLALSLGVCGISANRFGALLPELRVTPSSPTAALTRWFINPRAAVLIYTAAASWIVWTLSAVFPLPIYEGFEPERRLHFVWSYRYDVYPQNAASIAATAGMGLLPFAVIPLLIAFRTELYLLRRRFGLCTRRADGTVRPIAGLNVPAAVVLLGFFMLGSFTHGLDYWPRQLACGIHSPPLMLSRLALYLGGLITGFGLVMDAVAVRKLDWPDLEEQ